MAKRKTAMASEPRKPATGGGYKANLNMPLKRLSPGVYRGAGGGLVSMRGRPLQSQMGQRMAQSLPSGNETMVTSQNNEPGNRVNYLSGGMTGSQMPNPPEYYQPTSLDQMQQGSIADKMFRPAPGTPQENYAQFAAQQPAQMVPEQPNFGPQLSGYQPQMPPPMLPAGGAMRDMRYPMMNQQGGVTQRTYFPQDMARRYAELAQQRYRGS